MIGAPIFIGFVLLAAMLCWLLIYARGHWAVKAATTLAVLSFSFAVWHALGSYTGWPTTASPPSKSVFVGAVIHEPNAATGDKGTITIWLIPAPAGHPVLGYDPTADEPRAYRLPYSEPLHQAVLDAQRLQKSGSMVGFARKHRVGGARSAGNHRSRGRFIPYKLPTPQPPRK